MPDYVSKEISVMNSCPFRSAAYIKLGRFSKAYQDAVKAKELNAEWPKVRSPIYSCSLGVRCVGGIQEGGD